MATVKPRDSQAHEDLIRDASDRVLAAQAVLEVRVIEARKAGVTWATIGRACGIARWSASERFQRLPELQRTMT